MKKLISVFICVFMIFNMFPTKAFAEEKSLEEIIRPQVEAFAKSIDQPNANKKAQDAFITHGIGGNGSVDVADAYFARLVAAKIVKPTEEQLAFCDVDSDGKITAIDANLIRKFALGIIDELPIQ